MTLIAVIAEGRADYPVGVGEGSSCASGQAMAALPYSRVVTGGRVTVAAPMAVAAGGSGAVLGRFLEGLVPASVVFALGPTTASLAVGSTACRAVFLGPVFSGGCACLRCTATLPNWWRRRWPGLETGTTAAVAVCQSVLGRRCGRSRRTPAPWRVPVTGTT